MAKLGIVDVAGVRRKCALPAHEAGLVVDYWERFGTWELAALHYRLCNGLQGQSPSDGWPPPSSSGRAATEAKAGKRDQQIREGRAYSIVKTGRKAKASDEQIRHQLAAEGLEWPGEQNG